MSNFISDRGVWHPAKEKVGLTNKGKKRFRYKGKYIKSGEPFVYEGPDREAIKHLHEEGVETLGHDFRKDPDFLQMVRSLNFKSVDEYLEYIGYDENVAEEDFKKKISVVKQHELPAKAKAIKELAGGRDSSGSGKDRYGTWEEPEI